MGTDVHPAIEVLEYPEASKWTLVAIPPDDRNYEFFGLLAGVRGDLDPWVEPRGLPSHMSWLTLHADEGTRPQSPSERWAQTYSGVVDGDHTPS